MCGIPCIVTDMPNTNTVIADKVRGVAAEKRINQQVIAAMLGLSRTSITERYSGRVAFTAPELLTLATQLNVDVTRFFPLSSPVSTSPEVAEAGDSHDARRPVPDAGAAGVDSVRRAS